MFWCRNVYRAIAYNLNSKKINNIGANLMWVEILNMSKERYMQQPTENEAVGSITVYSSLFLIIFL